MQQSPPPALPRPDAISAAHSAAVERHLHERIAEAGGLISFAEFMHEVLYAPRLGYYSAGATKFGAHGDFVTAPEISSLFGKVLAGQCAGVLADVGRDGDPAGILELGAGSGKLAADILSRLAQTETLPGQYRILEVSADLRERQERLLRERVPALMDRIVWLDCLPEEHRGVIVANEVIDALPVERFVRHADHVAQLGVSAGPDGLALVERRAPELLTAAVEGIEAELGDRLADGYLSEVGLAAPNWIADLAASLRAGTAFLFDYGVSRREYYAPDRNRGWLRCHFRHHAHDDALILPGIQDITAWVDFSAIAAAAVDAGLDVSGYLTQAEFLINGGLAEELAGFSELAPAAQIELSAQVKLLTLPGEMGERFKCLAVSKGTRTTPQCFKAMDRTVSL